MSPVVLEGRCEGAVSGDGWGLGAGRGTATGMGICGGALSGGWMGEGGWMGMCGGELRGGDGEVGGGECGMTRNKVAQERSDEVAGGEGRRW